MTYNFDFELAALFALLAFVVVLYLRKMLHTLQNHLFKQLALALLFTTALDISTGITNDVPGSIPRWLAYTQSVCYFALAQILCVLLVCYFVSHLGHVDWLRRPAFCTLFIPGGIYFAMVLASPFTHWIFYYDEAMRYCFGPLHVLSYIVPVLYVVLGAAFTVLFRRRVESTRVAVVCCYCAVVVACTLIQMLLLPKVLLIYFGSTFAILMFYVTMESPDFFLDRDTGLYNMEGFTCVTRELFGQQKAYTCTVIVLPNLQAMASVYGVAAQRELALQIAEFLSPLLGRDCLYHLDVNRFAILERGEGYPAGVQSRIERRFSQPWHLEAASIRATARFLEIRCPQDGATQTDFFRTLEALTGLAMQPDAKTRVLRSSDELQRAMRREIAVQRAMETALAVDRLQIYLQPIIDTARRTVVSAEVLVRMQDPELGLVPPDSFIPLAERGGSIQQLGEQVFRKACLYAQATNLFSRGVQTLQINLSPMQCAQDGTAETLIEIAAQCGIPMKRLHLELTESAAMTPSGSCAHNLQVLKAAGAKLALDDYGTCYSNLSRISAFGIDSIKLDKSLVWAYCDGQTANLEYLVPMFKADGLEVVAEGVETRQQSEMMASLQCDYLQGYYYAQPMPAERFLPFVEKMRRAAVPELCAAGDD